MSKINKGQKVRVLKPGIFNESIGTIVSVSYKIDFGALGEWTFGEDDLLPLVNGIEGESPIRVVIPELIKPTVDFYFIAKDGNPNKIANKTKRPYNKQAKDKPVKEKRKYQRKQQ